MSITRNKEMELRSSDYNHLFSVTDGSTTIAAGEVVLIGSDLGFPLADVAISTNFVLVTKASQVRVKKAAEAIDTGVALFWDAGNNVITKTTATGLYPCGSAMEAAASGDSHILMNFDGVNVTAVPAP